MRKAILAIVLILTTLAVMAQDEHLKMQFNFENVEGKNVTDPVSGIVAKLMNQATVVKVGRWHALDLGNGSGYLDMTKSAGEVVRNLTDFTVSVCYRVDAGSSLSGAGHFLWCFSQSAANTKSASPYVAYRLNAQRMTTSTGGWSSETGIQVGSESEKGRWMNVLFRQSGQKGELFIDGKLVGQATNMPLLKNVLKAVPAYNWMGRAPFSSDSYLRQTLITDFRLYDVAVSDELVSEIAATATEIEQQYKYGEVGDLSQLQAVVNECKAWVGTVTTGYAPNAIAELQDEIDMAEMEVQKARASQILIDEYINTLHALLASAKATEGYQAKTVFPATTDHGFVHPGGIVSQQDIDRAKQLLADGDTKIKAAWQKLCANEYAQAGVQTYPTWDIIRGGGGGQNYMNAARGAAMAYQNALRWKIGGTKANADAAVRILMAWCNGCNSVGGDTNMSLAAGIYGYEFANAAELMRDYEGWASEDFEKFKQWMVRVWYNRSIDFLRRRHDTWLNARYSNLGERPGHYWSNWGLCNVLCVMSIGILCDDVHMYNQGVSFYKYDHVGTFKDRTNDSFIMNDGCDEFIGNLVPVVLPNERGPLGYLGQMQESGRDQGHTLMALGLALDICTVGLNQGDDLFAYMNDRIAAGTEFVAAMNFGGIAASWLPWKLYDYADCRGTLGSAWRMSGPNTGGAGEKRPYWERALGYYEGMRGVKMRYSEKASAVVGIDGGGGNYSQNSGGFDHLGFSTLTSYRPAISADKAITPLSGNIIYKGVIYENQTNLGGLKYKYETCPSKGIPADGSDITLAPQLPEGAEDCGQWLWNTGETTRNIIVKADRSYLYRVSYTAPNGAVSHQAFAIAVSGDAAPDSFTTEITANNETVSTNEITLLCGSAAKLKMTPVTGWTNDYLWDNGSVGSTITIPAIMSSRTYLCQYANQSGAVSEARFQLNVVPAIQTINGTETTESYVLRGSSVTLGLNIASVANPDNVQWSNGTQGATLVIDHVERDMIVTATYLGTTYTYQLNVKQTGSFSYFSLLTADRGYQIVTSPEELKSLAADHYFILASDDADLLIGLANAPKNGNKALFFQSPADPAMDVSKVFSIETYNNGFCLRNLKFDDLLLQTEWNQAEKLRTHDQPLPCEWARLLMSYTDGAWTIENGKYTGNFLGLWTVANGYRDGEETACNKTGSDIAHLQIFAIEKSRYNNTFASQASSPADISVLLASSTITQYTKQGWLRGNSSTSGYSEKPAAIQSTVHNGYGISHWRASAVTNSKLIYQIIEGLPEGTYTLEAYAAATVWNNNKGGDNRTGVSLFAAGNTNSSETAVTTATYGKYSVTYELREGEPLTIGLCAGANNQNTWVFLSDVTLTYQNQETGIEQITHVQNLDNRCYDLMGRPVSSTNQKRGVYIMNGKKILIK